MKMLTSGTVVYVFKLWGLTGSQLYQFQLLEGHCWIK